MLRQITTAVVQTVTHTNDVARDQANAAWAAVDATDWAAAASTTITALAALIGFDALIYQVRLQSTATRESNREVESQKLKLAIYERVLKAIEQASDADIAETTHIRLLIDRIERDHQIWGGLAGEPYVPDVPSLNRVHSGAQQALAEIIVTVEQWLIVDLRLSVFQTACNSVSFDVMSVWGKALDSLMPVSPRVPMKDGTVRWLIPATGDLRALLAACEERAALYDDFRREMQNLLLGDLFDNRVPPRTPISPSSIVVSLENSEAIEARLRNDTPWGKEMKRIEDGQRVLVAGLS